MGIGMQTFSVLLALFMAAPVFAQPPYVLTGEKEVLSFTTDKGRRMTVCIGKENNSRYLVYRFGKKDMVELEYPVAREQSFDRFAYWYYLRGG